MIVFLSPLLFFVFCHLNETKKEDVKSFQGRYKNQLEIGLSIQIMTESCKAVVVYKGKSMSHHNIYSQHHSKGGHQPHPSRQAEVSHSQTGGPSSDFDREESESSMFTGSSSTYGDDGHVPNIHQGSGSPSHNKPDPENNSLGNSIFYDDLDAVDISGASLSPPDPVLTAKAIERTKQKIENTKDQIRLEQVYERIGSHLF